MATPVPYEFLRKFKIENILAREFLAEFWGTFVLVVSYSFLKNICSWALFHLTLHDMIDSTIVNFVILASLSLFGKCFIIILK